MNLKSIFLSIAVCGIMLTAISCDSSNETTIKNKKLQSFLLAGVYTFHNYGGSTAYYPYIKKFIMAKPGSGAFLKQMSVINEDGYVFPYGIDDKSGLQDILSEWWGISNKAELMKTQEWLLNEGHHYVYNNIHLAIEENGGVTSDLMAIDLAKYGLESKEGIFVDLYFVKDNYSKSSKSGIKAWDIARYVNNINYAHGAGYLTDDEGIEMAELALAEAQKYYDNWEDYLNDWKIGRSFWSGEYSTDFDQTISDILDKENDYNIFRYIGIK